MGNFLWVKTKKREELLNALDSIPEYGKKSKSELMELALEDFVKKHSKSMNPQTQIDIFKNDGVLAIPNLYEAKDNPEMIDRFYNKIKSKKEYKEVDDAINLFLSKHNKYLEKFD